jgi:hypothetical protein
MKLHQRCLSALFVIGAIAGGQSITYAAPIYNDTFPGVRRPAPQPAATLRQQRPDQTQEMYQTGRSFFIHPPQLLRVTASQVGSNLASTYEVSLKVPEDAGQGLKAIKISQSSNLEVINFNVSQSQALVRRQDGADSPLALASVGGPQMAQPGEVTVVFEQPVMPGSMVTVMIPTLANPTFGGVYEFGVTAYPSGDNPLGQFLGLRRINFYGNSN